MKSLTYQDAGVDVAAQDRFTAGIREIVSRDQLPQVLIGPGLSAAAYAADFAGLRRPVLVSSMDGVGTKVLLASAVGQFETIGIDLVAMCANDCVTVGGRPLFFLDYLATARLMAEPGLTLVRGIVDGCQQAGCCLVGGETAEMPGVYVPGAMDLAGVVVGVAEQDDLIRGDRVAAGDVLIGLASNGLHANGFSLVRRVLHDSGIDLTVPHPEFGGDLARLLLTPTRIYVRSVLRLLTVMRPTGMVHVTGGGLVGRLGRLTGPGVHARVVENAIPQHPAFDFLRERGVSKREMRAVFNGGVGFVIATRPEDAMDAVATLTSEGERAFVLGECLAGAGEVQWA